jgi:hypothetical protein
MKVLKSIIFFMEKYLTTIPFWNQMKNSNDMEQWDSKKL